MKIDAVSITSSSAPEEDLPQAEENLLTKQRAPFGRWLEDDKEILYFQKLRNR